MSTKKELKGGLLNEPSTIKVVGQRNPELEKTVVESDPESNVAELVNRNSHPVTLSYNGEALILNPRERVRINNVDKLGGLCVGVFLNKIK